MIFTLLGCIFITFLDVVAELRSLIEGAHNVLHVVSLSIDEAAKVENHPPGLVALAGNGGICVLEG